MIGDIVTSKICNVQVIALRNCSQTNMTYSKSKGRWSIAFDKRISDEV